jgi:uncharacterized membrane protein YfcA
MYFVIGAIVGLVLTLTGSGGAILAIPLMVHLLKIPLADATIGALPIVGVSALIPLVLGVHKPNWKLLIGVAFGALPSTYLMAFIKPYIPPMLILISLSSVILLALYYVWAEDEDHEPSSQHNTWGRRILIGMIAGVLTTMTGLGGGVVLVPLLRKGLGISLNSASASSLGIIVIVVTSSFIAQLSSMSHYISFTMLGSLCGGILLANALATMVTRRCSDQCHTKIKRILFTIVALVSMVLLL